MDAGFLNVAEIGQYCMTKDTAEFSHFRAAACRVYALPRDVEASQPKGWIQGNTKIGPVLEVATCCLHSKYGVEIRIMSMNKDNSHSSVRNSGHEFEQQWAGNLRSAARRICVEIECKWFCMPIKDESKTTKTRTCRFFHKNNTYLRKILDRCWTRRIFNLRLCSVEEINSSLSSCKTTKRRRWSGWILENWRRSSEIFLALSSLVWRHVEEKHGRRITSSNTFIMSDVQSIYIPLSLRDWYLEVKIGATDRQYSFLPVDPMDKNQKDHDTIDLSAPRPAHYMRKAWKKHQNTVYWVDINLALKKGLKFYQTRSNAIILHETLPAYCIPKVVRMETGEVILEKVYASNRPPPKISLKHDWMKELGSEVAQRPEGQVVQQSKSSQLNQPNLNPDHDRTGQPVVGSDPRTAQGGRKTCRSQEIETRSFHEEAVKTW